MRRAPDRQHEPRQIPVTVTYLQVDDPGKITPPARPPPRGLATHVVHDFTRNRDLYALVGADYSWIDRLGWTDRQWRAWADRVETHLVEFRGAVAHALVEVSSAAERRRWTLAFGWSREAFALAYQRRGGTGMVEAIEGIGLAEAEADALAGGEVASLLA